MRIDFNTRSAEDYRMFLKVRRCPIYQFKGTSAIVPDEYAKTLGLKPKRKKSAEYTMEELEAATMESLAKTTKEWNITYGGEVPKLTEAKAQEVYDKAFWIKAQIEQGVEDSLGFMKA